MPDQGTTVRIAEQIKGVPVNVIAVVVDSLNRHHLSAYTRSPVRTPHLDAFAGRAWRFDNHFVGSLPCMPARRELLTGRREFLWRGWGPVEPFDVRLPELLATGGYTTGIVTDHYHYWEDAGGGYIQAFQSTEMIRGHEIDFWKPPVSEDEPLPGWVRRIERWRPGQGRQYYANVKEFGGEEDFFPAKVARGACAWLDHHATRAPFFLQVEMFDVHEPFHVPEPYASLYDGHELDQVTDAFTTWPPYQAKPAHERYMAEAPAEALAYVRSQYFGKVTMLDRWLGEVFSTLDRLELWEDTVVIVTTDHGHDLGERGQFGKSYPHYDSHANIPLFVWHPAYPGNGRNIAALTSTVDLFGTILDVAGQDLPDGGHSRSIMPLISGEATAIRDGVLYGTFGQGVCMTDGEWTVFKSPDPEKQGELFLYSSLIYRTLAGGALPAPIASGRYLPNVDLPQWKIPVRVRPHTFENALFNRMEDPAQAENLWDSAPGRRDELTSRLRQLMMEDGVPDEQWTRMGLALPR